MRIPAGMTVLLATQCPAAVGEIAYSIAVDRSRVVSEGILGAMRAEMRPTDVPHRIAPLVAHEADELADEPPVVTAFESPEADFVLVLSRFPGEAETDAHVLVEDGDHGWAVLHTRSLGRKPFSVAECHVASYR